MKSSAVRARVPAIVESLREAVLARPGDVETLLVYADALTEAGDPMGEIIHRQQLDPTYVTPDGIGKKQLGVLAKHLKHYRVVNGFLRAVTLNRLPPLQLKKLIGRPEWATVESLSFSRGLRPATQRLASAETVELITHPACASLKEVLDLDDGTTRRLAGLNRHFERVGLIEVPHISGRPVTDTRWSVGTLEVSMYSPVNWLGGPGRPLLDGVRKLKLHRGDCAALELVGVLSPRLERIEAPGLLATRTGERWTAKLTPLFKNANEGHYGVAGLVGGIALAVPFLEHLEIRIPDHGPETVRRIREAAEGVSLDLVSEGHGAYLSSHFYPRPVPNRTV